MARWFACGLIVVLFASTAEAGPWWRALLGHTDDWPNCVLTHCCDDYCRKPPPWVHAQIDCECPDFCRKCAPAVCPAGPFRCADYCGKPYPRVLCPVCGRFGMQTRRGGCHRGD